MNKQKMKILEKQNNNIKITGIKVANDNPINVEKPLPNWNFFSLFVSSAGGGKTSLVINLLKKYYRGQYDRIYFFSGSLHTLPEKFLEKLHPDRIYMNLENIEEIMNELNNSDEKFKTLVIIDDLVKEVDEKKNELTKLVFNRRHMSGGCSVWLITQKLNKIPLSIRSAVDTIYFFKNSYQNKKELNSLFEDYITSLDKDEFLILMKYIFKNSDSHMFAFLDLRNNKFYKRFNELQIKNDNDEETDSE